MVGAGAGRACLVETVPVWEDALAGGDGGEGCAAVSVCLSTPLTCARRDD